MFDSEVSADALPVRQVRAVMAAKLASLDASVLSGSDAAGLVEDLARLEAMSHTALVLVANRAVETGAWRGSGDKSAAHWLARVAGIGLGLAHQMLATSRRLEEQPVTEEAARSGELPRDKLHDVSDAAASQPDAESTLVDTAKRDSVRSTREACKRAKARGISEEEKARRAHAGRRVRARSNPDGTAGFDYLAPTAHAAEVSAALDHFQQAVFDQARRSGIRESFENYRADALRLMARTALTHTGASSPTARPADSTEVADESPTGTSPVDLGADTPVKIPKKLRPKIIIRVDHAALVRGRLEGTEVCEIAGIGPLPVETVRELLDDALLSVIVTDGVDIRSVAHHKRKPNSHQRTALAWQQTACTVEGCDNTAFIQIDHRTPWAQNNETALANLDPLCSHDHYRKGHLGYRLEPGTGRRRLLAPNQPDPPRAAAGPPPTPTSVPPEPVPPVPPDRHAGRAREPATLF